MPVNAVPQPETRMLIDLLRQVAIGATATYDDIARRVGFSVTDQPGRSRLAQARRIVMRDHQLVFGTIIRVGLKALEDTETVMHGSRSLASVRSAARRTRRITLSVRDYEALPPVDKSRQQAVVAVASAVETLASRKSVDAIVRAPVSPIVDLKAMVAALARPA
jgi:hypothetical protein